MTILNKFTIAQQIMETEDDDLLLQIKSLLETENYIVIPKSIQLVREEVAEYKLNPQDGFTKEDALLLLRAKLTL